MGVLRLPHTTKSGKNSEEAFTRFFCVETHGLVAMFLVTRRALFRPHLRYIETTPAYSRFPEKDQVYFALQRNVPADELYKVTRDIIDEGNKVDGRLLAGVMRNLKDPKQLEDVRIISGKKIRPNDFLHPFLWHLCNFSIGRLQLFFFYFQSFSFRVLALLPP